MISDKWSITHLDESGRSEEGLSFADMLNRVSADMDRGSAAFMVRDLKSGTGTLYFFCLGENAYVAFEDDATGGWWSTFREELAGTAEGAVLMRLSHDDSHDYSFPMHAIIRKSTAKSVLLDLLHSSSLGSLRRLGINGSPK